MLSIFAKPLLSYGSALHSLDEKKIRPVIMTLEFLNYERKISKLWKKRIVIHEAFHVDSTASAEMSDIQHFLPEQY